MDRIAGHDDPPDAELDAELDAVPCWPCRGRRPFSAHDPGELGPHLLATYDELERLDAWYCRRQAAIDQYAAEHRD